MQNFKKTWQRFFHKMFSAKSHTSRNQYNQIMIPIIAIRILLILIAFVGFNYESFLFWSVILLLADIAIEILTWIFGFCLIARRYHDIGMSKWFTLITFIPQIGTLSLIGLMFIPSNHHNR